MKKEGFAFLENYKNIFINFTMSCFSNSCDKK